MKLFNTSTSDMPRQFAKNLKGGKRGVVTGYTPSAQGEDFGTLQVKVYQETELKNGKIKVKGKGKTVNVVSDDVYTRVYERLKDAQGTITINM